MNTIPSAISRRAASVLFAVTTLLVRSHAFAGPAEDLKAVLRDFLDQPNYTWIESESTSRGMPEIPSGEKAEAVDGMHEKGGYTMMNHRRLPGTPPNGQRWKAFTDREDKLSLRWVFQTPGGWKWLRELVNPITGSGISRPDLEIAALAKGLESVTEAPAGVFHASISPAASDECLDRGIRPRVRENARLEATFWVRSGQLARYRLVGEYVLAGRTIPVDYIRELRDIGTTVIDVPPEVRRKFGETVRDEPDSP
jgi:hypothetical protein